MLKLSLGYIYLVLLIYFHPAVGCKPAEVPVLYLASYLLVPMDILTPIAQQSTEKLCTVQFLDYVYINCSLPFWHLSSALPCTDTEVSFLVSYLHSPCTYLPTLLGLFHTGE